MTKPNYCEIVVVLDRSGSMDPIAKDMMGGFDRFIAEQKLVPGECRVSLYQFDTVFEPVYEARELREVPPCVLVARGSTALLDAVGRTIRITGTRLAGMREPERPSKIVFFIITDGHENASREYTLPAVREMIEHQRSRYQWQFVYLGTEQDTFERAAELGVLRGQTFTYVPSGPGAQAMYASVAFANNAFRAGSVTMDWAEAAAKVPEMASGHIEEAPKTPGGGSDAG